MKCYQILLMTALMFMLVGCAQNPLETGDLMFQSGSHIAPVIPPPGFLFADYKAPLMIDFDRTPVNSPKKVTFYKTNYIYEPFITQLSFAWNDKEVLLAQAQKGGISKIHYADYELFNVLGIYQRFTVHIYGE